MDELELKDMNVHGLRVRYAEVGSGPPLVLIHGILVSHKEWLPVLPILAKKYRCIVLDLPGFGGSEKPPKGRYPYTREAFAETVADVLSALGVTKAHVCGHSMGGSVALAFAADRSELVDKLCVIDSACYPFDVPLKGRIPLLPVLGPLVFKKLYGRNLMRAYFRDEVWSGRPGLDVRRVDEYFDDFDPPDARDAAYEALKSTVDLASLGPKIARIRKPTLVIWGDDDRLFPITIAERLVRAIPGARLEVIANSGHAPNEQHPEATAKLLCDFFG